MPKREAKSRDNQKTAKRNPIVVKGKKDWIKLTTKRSPPDARERQAQRLYALMKGSIPTCCLQHEVWEVLYAKPF